MKITPQQRREVMALAQVSDKTLKRWLDKLPMKPSTKARVDAAWKQVRAK